jgi:pyruvate formate lyase activating enzyme
MLLNISNIQHFSTGDGEGIRTTVFFKGCNLRCPWCHNPENLSAAPSVMRYKAIDKTETLGKKVEIEDILPELLEDKDFFLQSGGGVTLSGGEVMLQADDVAVLVKKLNEYGISVLIDTAGCVPYKEFEKLNPLVQGYLFDFKTANVQNYREIGGDLETVTQNITRLISDGANVQVRIPLIPHFNTDADSILEICKHLKTIGIGEVELLPFHRLGSAKYEALGLDYQYKNYEVLSKDKLDEIIKQYSKYFKVIIER